MRLREATIEDIPQMQVVRNAVKENMLSDPALVPDGDYVGFLTVKGKGWVCETGGTIMGFAIADLPGHNIWALFIHPEAERMGLGRALHATMLDWYFGQTSETVWLSTSPGTRAAGFYRAAGWQEAGTYGKGELKFEMTAAAWAERMNAEPVIAQ